MATWSFVSLMICANIAMLGQDGKFPVKERPLHEHPTLVRMLAENNAWRARSGLAAQSVSPHLTQLAQRHAEWMASTRNFSHNYNHPYPEIIYWNASSIEGAFIGWINSGPHRSIIMGGNTHVGFGYAVSSDGQTYWCGVYGNMANEKRDDAT